ncbi:MAG: NTP transferase domain-containing protein [bacterium]
MTRNITTVILAAGRSVRMKSPTPKVLHKVCGTPIIDRIVNAVSPFSKKLIFVVNSKKVIRYLEKYKTGKLVFQKNLLGTANALLQTEKLLGKRKCRILVLPGDVPLLSKAVVEKFILFHEKTGNDISILTANLRNPFGYGRIIKRGSFVSEICEELDATEKEKRIRTVNGGIYIFPVPEIFALLKKVKLNPRKKEYYLTDVIKIAAGLGMKTGAMILRDGTFLLGVNTAEDLKRINLKVKS